MINSHHATPLLALLCLSLSSAACRAEHEPTPKPVPESSKLAASKSTAAPADRAAPKPAPKPPECRQDADCTRGWHPQGGRCGPLQRCFGGACVEPPAMTGAAHPETGEIAFETKGGETRYRIELVDEAFEIQRGLMCRPSMRAEWGMLFLMPAARPQKFWMKNTLIPLDMIFLDDNWAVVGVVARTEPQTLTSRGVDIPSRYVLELVAGAAAKAGIEVGAQARFFAPAPPGER